MTVRSLHLAGSQSIDSGEYDDESRELVLTFAGGRTYRYTGVPPEVAAGLETAPSPGSYWHRHKTRFAYTEE